MALPYTPLDPASAQIRVLRLNPCDSSPLSCSLSVVSLDDRPKFTALSYVWGDLARTQTIVVDGVAVEATQNLHDALHWYRRHRPGTPIWVDAVCINQADLREKSHQIGLMSRIYQEAHRVVCWLGPSTPQMDMYVSWGQRLARHWNRPVWVNALRRAAWHAVFTVRSWLRGESRLHRMLAFLQMATGQNEFLQLSYFQRMWTYQELVLSMGRTRFVLGGAVTSFSPHSIGIFVLERAPRVAVREILQRPFESLSPLETQMLDECAHPSFSVTIPPNLVALSATKILAEDSEDSKTSKLTSFLLATADRVCQNPRDKIYALLGLLGEQAEPVMEARQKLLAVDYSRPTEAVIRDALFYLYHYESANGFMHVCAAYKLPSRLLHDKAEQTNDICSIGGRDYGHNASWVPDMTALRQRYEFGAGSTLWYSQKMEVEWTRETCHTGHAHDALSFPAKRVATVVRAHAFPEAMAGIPAELRAILEAAKHLEARSQGTAAAAAGAGVDGPWVKVLSELGSAEHLVRRLGHAFVGDTTKSPAMIGVLPAATVRLLAERRGGKERDEAEARRCLRMYGPLRGQALLVLDSGRFAVCDATAQVGDVVFAAGCYTDFVLVRPLPADTRRTLYQLVGWPLVDGLGTGPNLDLEYVEQVFGSQPERVVLV
ncbi:heterokaryon incompatibility protein-domain-containing protein [Microdochium bolleyi]|uniref:Heterokaryon incompatibility protein-domain-containing protein n=1 Tax=Microdochium bolleyi TaxID=196109 RepID=A0A136IPX3_9PEZI|nr:heterokaryon incompatibility protein-domain-containing protein [Microdochium bolleyi]